MGRYFFHVHDDHDAPDHEGLVLADEQAARLTALRAARALMCEQVVAGRLKLHHHIEVRDERGDHLFDLTFRQAVQIED